MKKSNSFCKRFTGPFQPLGWRRLCRGIDPLVEPSWLLALAFSHPGALWQLVAWTWDLWMVRWDMPSDDWHEGSCLRVSWRLDVLFFFGDPQQHEFSGTNKTFEQINESTHLVNLNFPNQKPSSGPRIQSRRRIYPNLRPRPLHIFASGHGGPVRMLWQVFLPLEQEKPKEKSVFVVVWLKVISQHEAPNKEVLIIFFLRWWSWYHISWIFWIQHCFFLVVFSWWFFLLVIENFSPTIQ